MWNNDDVGRWRGETCLLLVTVWCASCSAGGGSLDGGAGASGNAGTDGRSCAGEMITFRMEATTGTSAWFIRDSAEGCAPAPWLSITAATGESLAIGYPDRPCCQHARCATCIFDTLCNTGWSQSPLPVSRIWDATMFPPGQCGANAMACVSERTCAPAGSYNARMCAEQIVDNQYQTACVDVPFVLPQIDPVIGVLPLS